MFEFISIWEKIASYKIPQHQGFVTVLSSKCPNDYHLVVDTELKPHTNFCVHECLKVQLIPSWYHLGGYFLSS